MVAVSGYFFDTVRWWQMKKSYLEYVLVIFIDTLGIGYLPSANVLEMLTSVTLEMLVVLVLVVPVPKKWRFAPLPAFLVCCYFLLLVNYLNWTNWLANLTNCLMIIGSCYGLYGYLQRSKWEISSQSQTMALRAYLVTTGPVIVITFYLMDVLLEFGLILANQFKVLHLTVKWLVT